MAGQLLLSNAKNWPKFEDKVFSLVKNGSEQGLFIALKILNPFFVHSPHVYDKKVDELYVIFKKSFMHQSNRIKDIGIQCYCRFLITDNKKARVQMDSLMVPFFEATYHLIVNDNLNIEGLQLICDLSEVFPKILKKKFN